jgi:streptomycin 6-kinase
VPEPARFGTPPALIRRIRDVHGERGRAWIERLPALLAATAGRWSIEVGEPFPDLSYNCVFQARLRDGTPAVLKAGVPCDELASEIAALAEYDGHGAVRLLAADAAAGVLLLERLIPGRPLAAIEDDDEATRVLARTMRALWRAPRNPAVFHTISDWGDGFRRLRARFRGGTGPFDTSLVAAAEGAWAELEASAAPAVLLHGDLHHLNVLSSRDGWLAIDPKGILGEPAFEPYALFRNPPGIAQRPGFAALTARRLAIVASELGLDRDRVRLRCFAGTVLSAWWSFEDHGEVPRQTMALAEILRDA